MQVALSGSIDPSKNGCQYWSHFFSDCVHTPDSSKEGSVS